MGAAIGPIYIWRTRVTNISYAPSISRRFSTRSIKGRIPSSLEMASDSQKDMALKTFLSQWGLPVMAST